MTKESLVVRLVLSVTTSTKGFDPTDRGILLLMLEATGRDVPFKVMDAIPAVPVIPQPRLMDVVA
jgi:hypothetical protein